MWDLGLQLRLSFKNRHEFKLYAPFYILTWPFPTEPCKFNSLTSTRSRHWHTLSLFVTKHIQIINRSLVTVVIQVVNNHSTSKKRVKRTVPYEYGHVGRWKAELVHNFMNYTMLKIKLRMTVVTSCLVQSRTSLETCVPSVSRLLRTYPQYLSLTRNDKTVSCRRQQVTRYVRN